MNFHTTTQRQIAAAQGRMDISTQGSVPSTPQRLDALSKIDSNAIHSVLTVEMC